MIKNFATIILLFVVLVLNAQIPEWEWARQYTPIGTQQHYGRVTVDPFGNAIVVGQDYHENTWPFYGQNPNSPRYDSGSFVAFYSRNGDLKWVKNVMGKVHDLACDVHGNILIAASFTGSISTEFGVLSSVGQRDSYIQKLTYTGKELWSKPFGGPGNDMITAIATGGEDEIFVGGSFESQISLDNVLLKDSQNLFISKLNGNGNVVWANNAPYTGSSKVHVGAGEIEIGENSIIYLLSYNDRIDCYDYCGYTSLIKYGKDGTLISETYLRGGRDSGTHDIAVDSAGNVFELWYDGYHSNNEKSLTKYDSQMTKQWSTGIGTGYNGYSLAHGISVGFGQNVFVGGFFGPNDYVSEVILGGDTLNCVGNNDVLVCEFENQNGKVKRAFTGGGGGFDSAIDLVSDKIGNCYVIGINNYFNPYMQPLNGADTAQFGKHSLITATSTSQFFVAKIKMSEFQYNDNVTIREVLNENQFEIGPNPCDGVLLVNHHLSNSLNIKFFDLAGHCVYESLNVIGNFYFNVGDFERGLYILEIKSENRFVRKKVIVN